jgi:hypothetical protein
MYRSGDQGGHDVATDLTPQDFLLWDIVKDNVYFPPLSADVNDVPVRITGSVAEVTLDK